MKQRTNEISTARCGHRSSVFYVARQKVRLDFGFSLFLFLLPLLLIKIESRNHRPRNYNLCVASETYD